MRSIAFLNTAFDDVGTDATIAQHIQTIVDREYVIERMDGATKHLLPSTLGIGLVEGYNQIGFDRSLSKPQLRREVCVLLSFVLFSTPQSSVFYPDVIACDLAAMNVPISDKILTDGARHGSGMRRHQNKG